MRKKSSCRSLDVPLSKPESTPARTSKAKNFVICFVLPSLIRTFDLRSKAKLHSDMNKKNLISLVHVAHLMYLCTPKEERRLTIY